MPPASESRIEEVDEDNNPIRNTLDDDKAGSSDSDAAADDNQASTSTSAAKKKKKKKSKAARALAQLTKGKKDEVPQEIVDHVVQEVRSKHGAGIEGGDEESIRLALEQLRIMDVLKGKTGLGGKNRKDMGEHKFWHTQPVPKPGDNADQEDGQIEPSIPHEELRKEPYPLLKDFEWCYVDTTDEKELKELYDLLSANYVEDDDASFRFNYSAEFLRWALQPPGWHKEWHIGVRVASNKKLVAFISAIPVNLRVRSNTLSVSEVNFLCIHKKLRSKQLAPRLIKEVTRQCHLKGVFQAIYTAGTFLPTPISTCKYYHRSLNVPKLVDVNFMAVPRNSTLAKMKRDNAVPSSTRIAGLREMEEKDVKGVCELYEGFMKEFDITPSMNEEEIAHYFLSGRGTGEVKDGRRDGQVVWSYVVEDPGSKRITDYFSFYSLPSSIMKNPKHKTLDAAYLFYYGSDVVFKHEARHNQEDLIRKRVNALITDALVIAQQANFDVFNALTLMYNPMFLSELKFGPGDGLLNYYLYNWRTAPMAGMEPVGDRPAGRGVGVVML